MATTELKVPDIGDFKEVEVIEVLVKAGDVVGLEQSLITVESDKASMEIPASVAGKIVELRVKVGDKVAEGSVLAMIEAADASGVAATAPSEAAAGVTAPATQAVAAAGGTAARTETVSDSPRGSAPTAAAGVAPAAASSGDSGNAPTSAAPKRFAGTADISCDMLVLGAGPGGYSAAFRAADLGKNTVLIERYATLGGVCLNVGCIPSKALLHVAAVTDEVKQLAAHGISFGEPKIDLEKLRDWKSHVVGKLTTGLSGMAKARKVQVVQGTGKFLDAYHVQVTAEDGSTKVIGFQQAIIAAGSEAVKLPFFPQDERIVTSTGALKLKFVPKRMLVVGGGIIGLEMATVYSTLGARIDVVEMLDGLMQGADRDLVKVWQKYNAPRFDNVMLKCKTVGAEAKADGIHVRFEGEGAPKEPQVYDLVLQAVGRRPNGASIGADQAGVNVTDRGFINVDAQMRTNQPHIFAIGDLVGNPMLAHKAVHEGHVAAEAAAGHKAFFDARVIPSVAYTDPEVAWVGVTEDEAKASGLKIEKATFPWAASGRAIANGRDEGFTKIIVDAESQRVIGGAIVGTHAGEMIGEFALAIEMGCHPEDIGKTIHPHPTLGESIGMVAELFEGTCTDLPPVRKK
jgi:dihydrolipoamide dehydrogenase